MKRQYVTLCKVLSGCQTVSQILILPQFEIEVAKQALRQHCLHSQISFWASILHNPIGWCIRGLTKTVMDTVVSTLALSSLPSTLLHGSHIVTHFYTLINKPWSCQCNLWSYSSLPPSPQYIDTHAGQPWQVGCLCGLCVNNQCLSPLTSRKLHMWRGRS